MRHLQLISLLAATAAFVACTDDELFTFGHTDQPLTPDIMDARTFFENRIAAADQDGTLNLDAYLAPGNVTPVWQKAVVTRTDTEEQVWVPFDSDWSYQVRVIVEFKDGSADYRSYPVRQVLLVSRNLADNTRQASFVTLTPTRDYHLKHRSNVLPDFLTKADHGAYSGLAFYYDAATMEPWKVEEYESGNVEFRSSRQNCNVDFSWMMQCITKNLEYRRVRIVFTKGGADSFEFSEEDGWMPVSCDTIYKSDFTPISIWIRNEKNGAWEDKSYASTFVKFEQTSCTWSSSYKQSIENFSDNKNKSMQIDPSSCVPNCLTYLHSIQSGDYSQQSSDEYERKLMTYYHDTYQENKQDNFDGVTTKHAEAYFKDIETNEGFFSISQMNVRQDCTQTKMNYDEQLAQKNYVITNVFSTDQNATVVSCHAVVIIGKNDNTGQYIYHDPSDGKIKKAPGSMFGTEYNVSVKLNSTSK